VRISATDWVGDEVDDLDGATSWTVTQSVELARILKDRGVDMIDCSSGAIVPYAKIPSGPGYQVPFAARIRAEAGIATAAVGLITEAAQAEGIVAAGEADLVLLAREFLREPYWPLAASAELGGNQSWPVPYHRAAPKGAVLREPLGAAAERGWSRRERARLGEAGERLVLAAGERR
jgi:2,4-dienoyl-CoA reductase-like NADH-dependent reductase (Old Yellow Enzyme family)